ncbi:MAG: AsmA-like C-terminal region-containing protein [Burkholderiales bacterium]
MNLKTIFTKTGKGMLEMKNKALPKDISRVLTLIDGKSSVGNLLNKDDKFTEVKLREVLKKLEDEGYIRVFSTGPETMFQADLDFTKDKKGMVVSEVKADVYNEAKARQQAQSQPPPRPGFSQPPPRPGLTQPPPKPGFTQPPRTGFTQPPSIQDLARAEAAARAKREAEEKVRKEAEAPAKAEAKAKSDLEARLRAEAEAKVRREAEAKSRAETEARAKAEAEAKAKRETEARLRAEAEARVRAEAEAKAKREAEARAKAEAEARAKTEAKAKEEAVAKARRETEAKAEAAARAKVEAEGRARKEAEEKAQADAQRKKEEAALSALFEEEAKARIEVESKSKVEADSRARAEMNAREETKARSKIDAERRLQDEIEAQLKAGERAPIKAEDEEKFRKEARAKAEEETWAKAEAEIRASIEESAKKEAKAKPGWMEEAEKEEEKRKAKEREEFEAKDRAKNEEKARAETEALRAAKAKAKAEEEAKERAAGKKARAGRKPFDWKPAAIGVAVLFTAAVGLIQFIPFNAYIPGIEKLAAETLHEPVTINSLHITLLPSPQVKLDGFIIGKLKDIKVETVRVSGLDLVLGGSNRLDNVEIDSTTLEQDVLARVALWGKTAGSAPALEISRVNFRNVRLTLNKIPLAPLQGEINLSKDGAFQKATLGTSDGKISAQVTSKDQQYEITVKAKSWQLPIGPELMFDYLDAQGVATRDGMQLNDIEAKLYGGSAKGTATIKWDKGWGLSGDFDAKGMELGPVIVIFARYFIASGTLDSKGRYTMQAQSPDKLFEDPRVDSSFRVSKGSLNNMDLTRALQAPSREGVRGGKTLFTEFSGNLSYGNGGYQFKDMRLVSGPLSATGSADISTGNQLAGRVNVELKSGATFIKNSFVVSGNINGLVLRTN